MKHQKVQGQKLKTFHFSKVLGSGAWAVVYEAFDQKTNSTVAVKAIPKSLMKQTPKLEELVRTEIRVLRECKNENVIRFVDNFSSEKTQFIVMQYCNGGDLDQYLKNKPNNRITQDEATGFLKQILNGFKGLHEVNAMHRDFKVANVLLHENICKIADLGFAKQMEGKKNKLTGTILGTSLTMAPELLREQKYGLQADIWSVGVVYYQLLYGKYPFEGNSDFEILKKIEKTKPDFSKVNISQKSRDFINKCLTDDPRQRITWREIYDHPLIREEEKLIYGLRSKINFRDNEEFYKGGVKINEDYIYAQKKENMNKKSSFDEIVESTNNVNMQKIKEAEEKKKISLAIQRYEKLYLNKRNNIMFIFKFVTPYIYNIFHIKANHPITMLILSKKAYHQMKNLHQMVKSRTNFLKLAPYFNQFSNSPKYQTLIDMTKSDIEIILAQINSYKFDIDISYCSSQIKKEYENVQTIYHKNWKHFVDQTISSYEFQLVDGLDHVNGAQKKDLIKIIKALGYYKENSEDADIQSFDRKMESMDFQIEEAYERSRLLNLLQGK